MVFSSVAWRYKDPLTAAKLEQMCENLETHDHRNDGSQGKALGAWATGSATEAGRAAAGGVATVVNLPAGRFATPPDVEIVPTYTGTAAVIESWAITAGPTTTSFTVTIYRSNAANTAFSWVATERR